MILSKIEALEGKLNDKLPGWDAQKSLSPAGNLRYREAPDGARRAGVLALLMPDESERLSLIYIKRPAMPGDKHSGQVSFPGGREEAPDNDLIETALRETREEIGVHPSDLRVLGTLTPLYVHVSDFLVQPTVAFIDHRPQFKLQASEVEYVITEYIDNLIQPDFLHRADMNIRGTVIPSVPYFKLHDEVLWGATAMITAELLHILRQI